MKIQQTLTFKKKLKKLPRKHLLEVELMIKMIVENPSIGERKKGDLADVLVHKFKLNKQLQLLAYSFDEESKILTLLQLGSHENFYRDLKA